MKDETRGTVTKTIDILEAFLKQPNGIGVSKLAKHTGLNISTVHRIASILVTRGYLKQERRGGEYSLGLKFFEFFNILRDAIEIREVARPCLEKLQVATGESVNLAILDFNSVLYVDHIDSDQMLRTFTKLGNKLPLHCTGVGKIFMADMDKAELSFLTPEYMCRFTKNTITDLAELEKELAEVKRDGVAYDNGEKDIDVRCIACPVRDSSGKVIAAISVSGPSSRLNQDNIAKFTPTVIDYVMELSRLLGYHG